MRVFENTAEKQPQNFYMPRMVDGILVYDVAVQQYIDATGIYYTRKCAKGIRRLHLTPFSATVYTGVDEESLAAVMTQYIIQEVSDDNGVSWYVPVVVDRMIDADGDGVIDFLLSTGDAGFCSINTIDNFFLENTGKQTYEISAPGKLTRLKLEVVIHNPMEASIDITDFTGPVEYSSEVNDTGEDVITYLFYPEGIEYAVIDPYLSVDEQATYTDVYCDGYVLRFYTSTSGYIMAMLSPTLSYRAGIYEGLYTSSANYRLAEDPLNTLAVTVNTKNYVAITRTGNLHNGSNYLTNSDSFELKVYCYPDKFLFTTKHITSGGNITIGSGLGSYRLYLTASLSSPTSIYNISGTEVEGGGFQNNAIYIGFTQSDYNITLNWMYDTFSSFINQYASADDPRIGIESVDITPGTHHYGILCLVDSAERVGGKQYDYAFITPVINDDFSSDSSADYTAMYGGLSVSDGAIHGTNWDMNDFNHGTTLGSPDHWVKAKIKYIAGDGSGFWMRVDPTGETGYRVSISSSNGGRITLASASAGSSGTVIDMYETLLVDGQLYEVWGRIQGSRIQIILDGIVVIDAVDTTYTTGNYTGISCNRGSAFGDVTVDDFSCGIFSAEDRILLGNQYHDIANNTNLPTVDTGTAVTDLNIPDHIDEGICSDGAQHIDLDSSHEAQITFNQDSVNQAVVLHEASIRTGAVGSPDEHCIFRWDCESTTAYKGALTTDTPIVGTLVGTNDFDADGERGKGFSQTVADGSCSFAVNSEDIITRNQGSMLLKVKKIIATLVNGKTLFAIGDFQDYLAVQWSYNGIAEIDAKLTSAQFQDTTAQGMMSSEYLQTVLLVWEGLETTSGNFKLFLDGVKVLDLDTNVSWDTSNTNSWDFLRFACNGASSNYQAGEWLIDSVRVYNKPILPYGSFIPGNITDYTKAHSDIIEYWDMESSTTNIGGETISIPDADGNLVTTDSVLGSQSFFCSANGGRATFPTPAFESIEEGCVGIWFKPSEDPTTGRYLWQIHYSADRDINDMIMLKYGGSGYDYFWFQIRAQGTTVGCASSIPQTDTDRWYWIVCKWKLGRMELWIDGILMDIETASRNALGQTEPLDLFQVANERYYNAYGARGYYDQLFISDKFNTPQIPFVIGKGSIHAPLISG